MDMADVRSAGVGQVNAIPASAILGRGDIAWLN
jgi:hypothetical protein